MADHQAPRLITTLSLQPLLSQIRRCQDFSAIGIPLEKCASPEWAAVQRI